MPILVVTIIALGFFYWWGHRPPSIDTSVPPIADQYDITAADNGKVFTYPVTSRFTVYLDSTKYDIGQLTCEPGGTLGSVSNIPAVAYPLQAKRFEATTAGTCTLGVGDFAVHIITTGTDY